MSVAFKKAVRGKGRRLKVAIDGVSGSGKTFTALRLGHQLLAAGLGKRIAVVDTERGSAALYAGESPDGKPWEFDSAELTDYSPSSYADAIQAATKAGYDVVIIDSLSHAWTGPGGAVEIADKAGQRMGGNKWAGWSQATPLHNQMIEAIIQSAAHVIATMRVKAEWTESVKDNGKKTYTRTGTNAVQRDGMEYEFDVHARMDQSHQITVEKTRCIAMDQRTATKPGPSFWQPLLDWWSGGVEQTIPAGGQHAPPPASPYPDLDRALTAAKTAAEREAVAERIKNAHGLTAGEVAQLRTRYAATASKAANAA